MGRLSLQPSKLFVVSGHREDNIDFDKNFFKLIDVLSTVATHYDYLVITSTHPRTQKRVDAMAAVFHGNVCLLKLLGFKDYSKLQVAFKTALSGSDTINEEFPSSQLKERLFSN